jgi:hypothetical protein
MDLISKFKIADNKSSLIRKLDGAERNAVISYFGLDKADDYQAEIALKIALEAKTSDAWIRCDCRVDQQPFIYPRLTETGSVTLVRPCSLNQTVHSEHCPFHLTYKQRITSNTVIDSKRPHFLLLKHNDNSNLARGLITQKVDKPARTNHSNITWNFLSLLERSAVFTLSNAHFPSYKLISDAILEYAKTVFVDGDKIKTLNDILLSSIKYQYIFFEKLRGAKNVEGYPAQGYIITIVDSITDKTLHCSTGIDCKVIGSIDISDDTTGPFLGFILCGESKPGNGYFNYLKASLISVYSRALPFPVFSSDGRELLKQLISWRMYWDQKGEDYSINWSIESDPKALGVMSINDTDSGASVLVMTEKMAANSDKRFIKQETIIFCSNTDIIDFKKNLSKGLWGKE